MARLSLYSDRTLVWSVRLEDREYLGGRDESCDLTLQSLLASRRHFRLVSQPNGGYLIEDLGSENGIYVDGVREYHRVLEAPVTIQVGDEVLLFDPDDNEGPAPPEPPAVQTLQVTHGRYGASDGASELPSTHGVGPVVLRRIQAETRLRSRPHLSLKQGQNERLFVILTLQVSTTTMMFCQCPN